MSLIDAIDDYLVDIQPSNTSKGLTILDEYEEALQVTAYETGEYMVAVPSARRKDPYNVSIHVSSGKLVAVCDCPAYKREKECQHEVNRFQDDDTIKVFLISLKAGGVGLNLTAADYVYLIDPWWNPAVEQQAIDRTHRIGQTRKIFAYKMICKDTVEEKILQLQQKKKALADDLVSEDAGFMKKLTRDDVAYLFS